MDLVWGDDRPDFPDGELYVLDLEYAGEKLKSLILWEFLNWDHRIILAGKN